MTRPGGSELTVPATAAKHIHRDVLSYPDAWYFAGGIAEFLLKRSFLFCSLLPEFVGVSHGLSPSVACGYLTPYRRPSCFLGKRQLLILTPEPLLLTLWL